MSTTLLTSSADLLAARREILSAAAGELAIFDRDLSPQRYDSVELHAALTAFLRDGTQRRLRVVVHDLQRLRESRPRLMTLLRDYGHRFTLRESPEHLKHLSDGLLLADGENGVVHFHVDQPRGKKVLLDADELRPYLQRFEDLWAECGPPASAAVLGL